MTAMASILRSIAPFNQRLSYGALQISSSRINSTCPTTRHHRFFGKKSRNQKSSEKWFRRHRDDPFVRKSQRKDEEALNRAHYKLEFIDAKYQLLASHQTVIDLGSAPGGWTSYAARRCQHVLSVDMLPMDSGVDQMDNVDFVQGDFTKLTNELMTACDGAHVVLSDMAPNFIGDARTDCIRAADLCQQALQFSMEVLQPQGNFVGKLFSGPEEQELKKMAQEEFFKVTIVKPPASRKESGEKYLVGIGRR